MTVKRGQRDGGSSQRAGQEREGVDELAKSQPGKLNMSSAASVHRAISRVWMFTSMAGIDTCTCPTRAAARWRRP